jgi:hypothetical protein
MALARGSAVRQGLPPELVIHICRLAGFESINRAYALESPLEHVTVRAFHSGEVASKMWFQTQPLTKRMLSHIKSIQLVTLSRHQGWVSDPNVSTFIAGIDYPWTPTL